MSAIASPTAAPVIADAAVSASKPAKPAKKRGPLHYVGVAVSAALLMFVAIVALLVVAIPAATGSTPYTVLTSSMEPKYPAGTLVVIKPVSADSIGVGDVITYQLKSGEPEVVTHRVIAVNSAVGGERTFTTQGDNNDIADAAPVREVQVRGELWYAVPFIGWVNNVINGGTRAVIVPIAAVILFGYAGWMFVGSALERRRKRREAEAAAQA
ncbi:signal peptidase I [Schumannella sp. 10F1B-5-1]|uniref:signal peptidase I n=1 Tax=Schumannella sp. 10F1B-5-1 TaxID=2590780 RepID=UPI001131FACF|nr:signal peptidase I [Schumannella sp. 10F1B-5-1]TPW70033.1 signal peptidase I [Schumannella sp. 10F1B-5-1]